THRLDPDPPFQEDADPRSGMGMRVGDGTRRELDAVAAQHPLASLGDAGELPEEGVPLDACGSEVGLPALDIVDDAGSRLRLDAARVFAKREDLHAASLLATDTAQNAMA